MAENPQILWKLIANDPFIEIGSQKTIVFPLLSASAINVINAQKLWTVLSATFTLTPVVCDNRSP